MGQEPIRSRRKMTVESDRTNTWEGQVLQNRPRETIAEEVAIQWDESVSEDYSEMQEAAQSRGMSAGFRVG